VPNRWIPAGWLSKPPYLAQGLRHLYVLTTQDWLNFSRSALLRPCLSSLWLRYRDGIGKFTISDCTSRGYLGGSILLSVLPISVGGWGVREAGMVSIFGALGVPSEPVSGHVDSRGAASADCQLPIGLSLAGWRLTVLRCPTGRACVATVRANDSEVLGLDRAYRRPSVSSCASCAWRVRTQSYPDTGNVHRGARDLISGEFTVGMGRRTPGYPLFIAALGEAPRKLVFAQMLAASALRFSCS
jgi:hypothetical protein